MKKIINYYSYICILNIVVVVFIFIFGCCLHMLGLIPKQCPEWLIMYMGVTFFNIPIMVILLIIVHFKSIVKEIKENL